MTLASNLIDCGSGVRLERTVPCRMSDGVTLYSDHYYPPEPGPHPTLLMRQPYGRDIASTVVYAHPIWFARHGYNVVIQDVRGRGDSEGDFYPFHHERQDGAESIAWLLTRPECNGRIGMYGFSYQGLTQLLAAAAQPPGLICIAPAMTACDLYHGWFYHNGALRLASTLGWGLQMLKADARRLKDREASDVLERAWADLRAQFLTTPCSKHPVLAFESLPTYLRDWLTHSTPGEYWSALDISDSLSQISIPALHVSGWYDTYLKGSVDGFNLLRTHAATAFARDNQYLLAGPWVHIPWGDQIGEVNFGPDSLFDTDAILLRWFNHWLKDSGEFASEPRIRHFALGANSWHSANSWPTSSSPSLDLFLHSHGRANSRKGNGLLSNSAPSQSQPPDTFSYDPEVPVSAPGGLASLSGCTNQASLELGNNLLVYTTAPVIEAVHIFGTPRVSLYAATSAAHADLTAKLVRVTPTGRADFISIGIARSSFLFKDSSYKPDTIHLWAFDLEPASVVFAPGESIRIEIAASAYPLYDRNPSTAVAPADADSWNWARSTHSIYHDAEHSSVIHLPLAETTV